jgi:nucleoside-diphosphate-sugar epimerase
MKIFVTGASGYIGSAVCEELARAGHEVLGLVRSEAKGRPLAAREIRPVVGTMQDPDAWIGATRDCSVLVHCAAEMSPQFHALDRQTIDALLGSPSSAPAARLVLYTSGVWVYGDTGTRTVDESTPLRPPAMPKPRAETEERVLAANTSRLRTLVLRPGCVYGGSGSLTAMWFDSAAKSGAARIVGDGSQRWAMVHRDDLALAYRLAIESSCAGEVFNVTDRSRFTVHECASAASRLAGTGAVESLPLARATQELGSVAECLAMTQHVDSSKAARVLGWNPRHGGFVDGVERYFTAWKASRDSQTK